MPTIDELQEKIESLSKKQLDIETQIQKNLAKKEMYINQLKDEFGIEAEDIKKTLAELEVKIAEEKKKFVETVEKFTDYLKKIGEKIA